MSETPQEYSQRIIRTLAGSEPLKVLEETVTELDRLTDTLKGERLKLPRAPGQWSAAQILSHLAEGEIVFAYRLRTILSSDGSHIQAYDQEIWVKNSGYLQDDPLLALNLFRVLRNTNLARLRSLNPEQWNYAGIHSERGRESIADMARLTAGHDLNHLKQLKTIAAL